MLVIHTTIPFDSARREEVMELVSGLVECSKTEDGTVRYRAMIDIDDPSVMRFFEQYEDAAAAETHTKSVQYRRFVKSLPDLVDGKIETIQFETDEIACTEFTASDAAAALD
ncbi:putative quinol monooxygenase [Natribaculum luteum]|uniref:Quinol monooxygenase n=1 Tax=Natribaculum luteum TaxID=1586232 RepID=A0ABD5P1C0_9EURY|nr:putative quinol monooxygenase [Natribaculum luteum]